MPLKFFQKTAGFFGGRLRRGRGRNRQPDGFGLGPDGQCICPNCGTKASHQRGTPCYEMRCPKCGQSMTRER